MESITVEAEVVANTREILEEPEWTEVAWEGEQEILLLELMVLPTAVAVVVAAGQQGIFRIRDAVLPGSLL